MPELKRTFSRGRMNRDFDDRLLPAGTYRDASNIQVTNSAGGTDSDIGAIETVLGNNKQNFHSADGATIWADNFGLTSPTCIGVVKDNQNNKIYWFLTSVTADCIMEYDEATSIIAPVIVDTGSVLNFSTSNLITGVNILEDMLFFTDNLNEPRKLNIDTFKSASSQGVSTRDTPVVGLVSGTTNIHALVATTVVYDTSTPQGNRARTFKARDIEVITEAPRNVLTVDARPTANAEANAASNFNGVGVTPLTTAATSFDAVAVAATVSNLSWTGSIAWTSATGTSNPVVLTHVVQNEDLTEEVYEVRGYFSNNDSATQGDFVVVSKTANIAEDSLGSVAWQMLLVEDEPIFENDFPRFAYRYRYLDGQYSPLSPFSDAAFVPGQFEYKGMDGENKGMTSEIRTIHLSGIISFGSGPAGDNVPRDVTTIEMIYKGANSNALYVIDELDVADYATFPANSYPVDVTVNGIATNAIFDSVITSDSLGRIIEDAQLLRLYDNVPRKALAQEVIGNRVVYGNYLQNQDVNATNQIITAGVSTASHGSVGLGKETVKSGRSYQLGIAYMDEKGRTSPVFSRPESSVTVNFKNAEKVNKLTALIDEVNVPSWAAFGKWYIKNNTPEYYNLALDRFYEAEDGSTWLAFPSSERNKLKEGDFLKLKKQHDSTTAVTTNNKYKVLDIKNEVPKNISNVKEAITIAQGAIIAASGGTPAGFVTGRNRVKFYGPLKEQDDDLSTGGNEAFFRGITQRGFIQFKKTNSDVGSDIYQIESGGPLGGEHAISGRHYNIYEVILTENLKAKDEFLNDLADETSIRITLFENKRIELPEFQGRFFVRINPDGVFRNNVKDAFADAKPEFVLDSTKELDATSTNFANQAIHIAFSDKHADSDSDGDANGDQTGDFAETVPSSSSNQFRLFIGNNGWSDRHSDAKFRAFKDQLTQPGTKIKFKYGDGTTSQDFYTITDAVETTYNRATNSAGDFTFTGGSGIVALITMNRNFDDTQHSGAPNASQFDKVEIYRERRKLAQLAISSDNPAIFETDPTDLADVDLFYEASTPKNIIKAGMLVSGTNIDANTTVSAFNLDASPPTITLNQDIGGTITAGATIKFDSSDSTYRFTLTTHGSNITSGAILSMATGQHVLGMTQTLEYHNAYSFGNGVESDRVRDDFNAPMVGKGVKVSSTLQEPYKEERRGSGLIYSGIYNSRVGFNESNQFSAAGKITKDLNPVYGTIQKLSARGAASMGDLLVLCEDKCFRVLANKDALFNADGSPQLTASTNVLGQIIPFAGEYGISTNPESFAYWGFRSYFADKSRGVILRLSRDGLTDISAKGMGNFFTEQLKNSTSILNGSYDEDSSSYNLRIGDEQFAFNETADGWTSKLTYIPEAGISLNNEYYTFKGGEMWKHNNSTRANFYGTQENSIVSTTFNASSGNIKNFKTLSYEGDAGWTATFTTDQQEGQITSFVEREGKYYNYINGTEKTWSNSSQSGTLDFKDFNVQGIGQPISVSDGGTTVTLEFASLPDFAINKLSNTAIGSTTTLGSDIIFYVNATTGLIYKIGNIRSIPSTNNIMVHNITSAPVPTTDDLVFVSKDNTVNTSGIIGYFNRVTLTNTNADKNELFAIGSEVFISS